MTNVIGPIEFADWYTMRMLRENIREMKLINLDGKYDIAINKQQYTLQDYFDTILGRKDKLEDLAA